MALKVEDVLGVVEEPVAGEQRAELPHLVPEQRVVPVLDVEVVALHVGEHRSRETQVLIERREHLRVSQQRAALAGDAVSFGADLSDRTGDVLAILQPLDVVAEVSQRNVRIVDPRPVMVIEAVAVGVVEPRLLDRLPIREPLLAGVARRQRVLERSFALGRGHGIADPQLDRAACEALELVVRAEQHDIDPADHRRDRLVGNVGELLLAQLVEHEVRGISEIQKLEVVLPDPVDALEQPVVRDEQR